MKTKIKITLLLLFLNVVFCKTAISQTVPQGISYQGIARNSGGTLIISQPVSVKLGIYSPTVSGTLHWEETHNVTTNQLGLFYFIIGQGTTTGAGAETSFSGINWGAATHFIKIAMDETGGTTYVDIDTIQFWSVPYAMYSSTSSNLSQPLRLHPLADVDTIGVASGYVLKWNGSVWLPAPDNDSDTAMFAYNSTNSITSDTANYAFNVLSVVDTINFAYNADSAAFSTNSTTSVNSTNSNYCDTATYALNSGSSFTYWNLTGNSGTSAATNFVGTTDNVDLVVKTNNTEKMRITTVGKIGIGTTAPTASLHVVGNDGILAEGTFGSGVTPPSGAGTRMVWYPQKAAFRAGGITGTHWDNSNIGIYSFAACNNTIASGSYSTAFGLNSTASGIYSIVAGQGSIASGNSSIAMGSTCTASGVYSIAMCRGTVASDSASVSIGYHSTSTGKYALSFGYETDASGNYSTALGYYSNTNGRKGSFVYADQSSITPTNSTADNQFMVRASGGVVFYSNTALTAGVTLAAGGGSWASVSDKHKKEHFKTEDANAVLNKLAKLEITSWNYKSQSPAIRHIGPMAQDFYQAFQFGESDTTITTIDVDGISLLAIQALAKKTEELKQKADEVEKLNKKVDVLLKEKALLEKRISTIEKVLIENNSTATVSKN